MRSKRVRVPSTGQEKKKTFETQLLSRPGHFSLQLPPLKYYLPDRCDVHSLSANKNLMRLLNFT